MERTARTWSATGASYHPQRVLMVLDLARAVGHARTTASPLFLRAPVFVIIALRPLPLSATATSAEVRSTKYPIRAAAVVMARVQLGRFKMYKKSVAIIFSAALALTMLVTTDASAKPVTLSGTFSRSQVKKDCAAVSGGHFGSYSDGSYSCVNVNNGNSVHCTGRGKCYGSVARRGKPPHTIGGILHSPSTGVKSSGNNPPSPSGHRRPAKFNGVRPLSGTKAMGGRNSQPVTVMRSEGHHFGGHK